MLNSPNDDGCDDVGFLLPPLPWLMQTLVGVVPLTDCLEKDSSPAPHRQLTLRHVTSNGILVG